MDFVDQPDRDIIARITNGDKDLYRILMKRYASLVFHVVQRYEKNSNQIDEMAHEIFLKAYERLQSYQGNSAFSSWLYRLAQNHCIDHTRRRQRYNDVFTEFPDDHSHEMYSDGQSSDDNITTGEQMGQLQNALERISESCSIPLLMKYRDGMSYEAISEALDVSVGALKVRVHRARKELKQYLELPI